MAFLRRGFAAVVMWGVGASAVRRPDIALPDMYESRNETLHGTSFAQRSAQAQGQGLPLAPVLTLTLRAAAHCQPAPYHEPDDTVKECVKCNCGEDAFFVANPTPRIAAIGVADGVGGWRNAGVDPAFFSWGLMNECQDAAEAQNERRKGKRKGRGPWRRSRYQKPEDLSNPRTLLEAGFKRMHKGSDPPVVGGSTACLASLDRHTGILSIANLGDSGALVIRGSEVLLESRPQQFAFNYPYQLSVSPEGEQVGVTPDKAEIYSTRVQEGDIIILMTDGILDNLSKPNIKKALKILKDEEDSDPAEIAQIIVELAHSFSNAETDSPFSLAARAAGFYYPPMGKPDDMTVVVAKVEGVAGTASGHKQKYHRSQKKVTRRERSQARRQRKEEQTMMAEVAAAAEKEERLQAPKQNPEEDDDADDATAQLERALSELEESADAWKEDVEEEEVVEELTEAEEATRELKRSFNLAKQLSLRKGKRQEKGSPARAP